MFPAPCPRRAFAPRILNNCRVLPLRGQVLLAENTPGNRNNGGLLSVPVSLPGLLSDKILYGGADVDLEIGCASLVPRHNSTSQKNWSGASACISLRGTNQLSSEHDLRRQRGTCVVVNHTNIVRKQALHTLEKRTTLVQCQATDTTRCPKIAPSKTTPRKPTEGHVPNHYLKLTSKRLGGITTEPAATATTFGSSGQWRCDVCGGPWVAD